MTVNKELWRRVGNRGEIMAKMEEVGGEEGREGNRKRGTSQVMKMGWRLYLNTSLIQLAN